MPTPFSDPKLWQHGTFTFNVPDNILGVDSRGNKATVGRAIALTFKLKPGGGGGVRQGEASDSSSPIYLAKLVAIDGDFSNYLLPKEINIGDVGEGAIASRECKAIIRGIDQSSLSPLLEKILGSAIFLQVEYRVRRGNSG